MIALLLALLFAATTVQATREAPTDLVCDSYYFDGLDSILCHCEGCGNDIWLDHAFMGFDVSPDDGQVYTFVSGYPRKESLTTEL